MFHTPAHKQTNPAALPAQIVNRPSIGAVLRAGGSVGVTMAQPRTVGNMVQVGDTITFKTITVWNSRKVTRKVVGIDRAGRALVRFGGYDDFIVRNSEIVSVTRG